MSIDFRISDGLPPQRYLGWDTVWDSSSGLADWAYSNNGEIGNSGGLRAVSSIETALILSLFTDKRCPKDHPLAKYADNDPRGWWGNSVDVRGDLGETEMGSLLWLLERAPITEETLRWAQSEALASISGLIDQGVAVQASVFVEADRTNNRINLAITLYGQDGSQFYSKKFSLLWGKVP